MISLAGEMKTYGLPNDLCVCSTFLLSIRAIREANLELSGRKCQSYQHPHPYSNFVSKFSFCQIAIMR